MNADLFHPQSREAFLAAKTDLAACENSQGPGAKDLAFYRGTRDGSRWMLIHYSAARWAQLWI